MSVGVPDQSRGPPPPHRAAFSPAARAPSLPGWLRCGLPRRALVTRGRTFSELMTNSGLNCTTCDARNDGCHPAAS